LVPVGFDVGEGGEVELGGAVVKYWLSPVAMADFRGMITLAPENPLAKSVEFANGVMRVA
jgi:hypothetical protein